MTEDLSPFQRFYLTIQYKHMPNYLKRLIDYLNNLDRENGININLQQEGNFHVKPVYHNNILIGVEVSNLGTVPFLPLSVFAAVLLLLQQSNGNPAPRGNVFDGRLGDPALPLDSVEGYVAHTVYGKELGDNVFRRITPIAQILMAAGVCTNQLGALGLNTN
jgi:hypothetical protein